MISSTVSQHFSRCPALPSDISHCSTSFLLHQANGGAVMSIAFDSSRINAHFNQSNFTGNHAIGSAFVRL